MIKKLYSKTHSFVVSCVSEFPWGYIIMVYAISYALALLAEDVFSTSDVLWIKLAAIAVAGFSFIFSLLFLSFCIKNNFWR